MSALLAALAATAAPAPKKPAWDPRYEAKVGKEAAAEVDKEYDRVDDKDALAKLQAIADALAVRTRRPEVKYDVRLVKEKKPGKEPEVNAFSLPGGIIYVTQGLLQTVQSEHELAGVLAHEIAHNTNYDGLTQAARASKIFKREMALVLASLILGGMDAAAFASQAGLFYRAGVLGGYSIEMEKRADEDGARAMVGTQWDPVGLLTFMERLAAEERRTAGADPGVFRTHPDSTERVALLIKVLEGLGVEINRRKVTKWEKPVVEERQVNGKTAQAVVFQGQVIFACDTPDAGTPDAKQRAEAVAAALTAALADGAQLYHFTVGKHDGAPALFAYGAPVFVARESDAALLGKTPDEVVQAGLSALRIALYREGLDRLY